MFVYSCQHFIAYLVCNRLLYNIFLNLQDTEVVESTSGPDKETDGKDKERVQTAKESSAALLQSQDALASDKPLLLETWVDLHNFTKCFQ